MNKYDLQWTLNLYCEKKQDPISYCTHCFCHVYLRKSFKYFMMRCFHLFCCLPPVCNPTWCFSSHIMQWAKLSQMHWLFAKRVSRRRPATQLFGRAHRTKWPPWPDHHVTITLQMSHWGNHKSQTNFVVSHWKVSKPKYHRQLHTHTHTYTDIHSTKMRWTKIKNKN